MTEVNQLLSLTEKLVKTVLIGKNIRIMVVEVRGKQVRLGIEAPPDLLVLRTKENRTLKRSQQSQTPEIIFPTNARSRYAYQVDNYLY